VVDHFILVYHNSLPQTLQAATMAAQWHGGGANATPVASVRQFGSSSGGGLLGLGSNSNGGSSGGDEEPPPKQQPAAAAPEYQSKGGTPMFAPPPQMQPAPRQFGVGAPMGMPPMGMPGMPMPMGMPMMPGMPLANIPAFADAPFSQEPHWASPGLGMSLPPIVAKRAAQIIASALGFVLPDTAPPPSTDGDGASGEASGSKRKRSRWGDSSATGIMMTAPTTLPAGLTPAQEAVFLDKLRVDEISTALRLCDYSSILNARRRSPSPEPVYNQSGQRLNTREVRAKQKLEKERHDIVQRLTTSDATYRPPADYRPPEVKLQDKVHIPQDEHPDINFMGLLIGPRGRTLKQMEKDTGAKIMIRGQGSVKEGRGKDNRQQQRCRQSPVTGNPP